MLCRTATCRRQDFEKSSQATVSLIVDTPHPYNESLPPAFRGRLRKNREAGTYGLGEVSAGDSVVPAGDSVVVAGLVVSVVVAGLVVSVVAAGVVAAGLAAGSVVSVFCSQAAKSAALARMQMYFFIVIAVAKGILL